MSRTFYRLDNMTDEIDYKAEYDKAQIILGFVLQAVGGSVTIERHTELPENATLEFENNENSMTLRLVSG